MKKKYLRKKKDVKDATRSGTSTDVVNKAEKALRTYEFLGWLDDFVQSREGRSNLPMMEQDDEETNFDAEDVTIETAEDAIEESQSNSESIEIETTEKVKSSGKMAPKSLKKRPGIKGAAKENLLEEMEFSLISKINDRLSGKRKAAENDDDNEDIFCKSLALDLKELPLYERCIAKQEMRNVIFKHQMSVMNKEFHPNVH